MDEENRGKSRKTEDFCDFLRKSVDKGAAGDYYNQASK